MTTAAALLADLRSRGIDLETDGIRLRWRPDFMVPKPVAKLIRSHQAELIDLADAIHKGKLGAGIEPFHSRRFLVNEHVN